MRTQKQARGNAANGFARRFSIGLSLALAFVLVAFEWKTDGIRPITPPPDLPLEAIIIDYPAPYPPQEKTEGAESQQARKRNKKALITSIVDEPTGQDDGALDDQVGTENPGSDDPGPAYVPYGEEKSESLPLPYDGVEQRPYFRSCLEKRRVNVDECTERIIEMHLKRNFVVPENMRREERTTVSIVIDVEGRIEKVLCAPKPSPAVAAEIERVIRALPPMNPATQNGLPVPVVFQLPFRVSRI
ncbi:MAG: hypothetical protein WAT74_17535 [Flavobacteriales bacterium]